MSWGERSCIWPSTKGCPISDVSDYYSCNVDCKYYKWDGKTSPDSVPNPELLGVQELKNMKVSSCRTANQRKRDRKKRKVGRK